MGGLPWFAQLFRPTRGPHFEGNVDTDSMGMPMSRSSGVSRFVSVLGLACLSLLDWSGVSEVFGSGRVFRIGDLLAYLSGRGVPPVRCWIM